MNNRRSRSMSGAPMFRIGAPPGVHPGARPFRLESVQARCALPPTGVTWSAGAVSVPVSVWLSLIQKEGPTR